MCAVGLDFSPAYSADGPTQIDIAQIDATKIGPAQVGALPILAVRRQPEDVLGENPG